MNVSPEEPQVVNYGRDFPWSPIVEALQSLFGCLVIVFAMAACGAFTGYWLAHVWMPAGIWYRSALGQWPVLLAFSPEAVLAALVTFATWHKSVFFPATRTLVAVAAVPFLVWSVAVFSTVVRLGAAPPVPPQFVGVWVSDDAQFNGELLVEGRAIYLDADGFVAVIGSPPPVVLSGKAAFDSGGSLFRFALNNSGSRRETMTMNVVTEPTKRMIALESSEDAKGWYTQRGRTIPKWVKESTR